MKKNPVFYGLVVGALLVCSTLEAVSLKATVIKVTGKVEAKSRSGSWRPLKLKAELSRDYYIKTGENSSATLKIGDKGLITIHELSSMKLSALSSKKKNFKVKVKLFFGKLWNRFKKNVGGENSSMSVDTPAAVAAVRGTSFFVESDKVSKNSTIGVWEGAVEVKASRGGTKKLVEKNYEIIVLYNKPLQDPVRMQQDKINREREFQETIKNLGVANAFPAARGIAEINDMQVNEARDTIQKAHLQVKGDKIIYKDFIKLKQAIARLYADTKYHPGKEVSGRAVRKGYGRSLECLIKNQDRAGKKIKKWHGPYLDSDLKDPFGNKYGAYLRKSPRGNEYVVIYSLGLDKSPSRDDTETIYSMNRLKQDAKNEKKKR
jgi:hypothetical protein